MDLNAALDIIIRDLNEATEIIDDLKGYQGVPYLQVELAKSRCRSAAQMIALLKDHPGSGDNRPEFKPQEKPREASPIPQVHIAEQPAEPEIPQARDTVPEIERPVKIAVESSIIADQFSNMPESFNEKLGYLKHDEDITDILKSKPVSSLTEAIGINDKFLFIREIFNGSLESYNNAITRLEAAPGLDEARGIISSFTDIPAENETMKQLMDLLKRKFPSDE
jgi:hypothetical protein